LKSNEIQDEGRFAAVASQEDFPLESQTLRSPSVRNTYSLDFYDFHNENFDEIREFAD
jgi:hypothetical protein